MANDKDNVYNKVLKAQCKDHECDERDKYVQNMKMQ